eukprot:COSAG02_NODE_335_length_24359_cov_282.817354_10_plen_158_part_00
MFVAELCVLRTFGGGDFSLIFICAQYVPEFLWDRLRASIEFPVMPKRVQYARSGGECCLKRGATMHPWGLPLLQHHEFSLRNSACDTGTHARSSAGVFSFYFLSTFCIGESYHFPSRQAGVEILRIQSRGSRNGRPQRRGAQPCARRGGSSRCRPGR